MLEYLIKLREFSSNLLLLLNHTLPGNYTEVKKKMLPFVIVILRKLNTAPCR